ncbi:MAG: urease accessory protein UreF [Gammaproteobacteria bacterium]
MDTMALLRLLQLASPGLPIGAYAYSQGLEWAVEAGWVHDVPSLARWIGEALDTSLAQVDVPALARLHRAASTADAPALAQWSAWLLANRETRELRQDDCARGQALARLARELDVPGLDLRAVEPARTGIPLALPFAQLAVAFGIPRAETAQAYSWGWLENQVLCGVKLVPLGQFAGQRLLRDLAEAIPAAVVRGLALDDDDLGATLPRLAIASSRHETQYTRLFRS